MEAMFLSTAAIGNPGGISAPLLVVILRLLVCLAARVDAVQLVVVVEEVRSVPFVPFSSDELDSFECKPPTCPCFDSSEFASEELLDLRGGEGEDLLPFRDGDNFRLLGDLEDLRPLLGDIDDFLFEDVLDFDLLSF
jgi:hypothetical protein